MIGQLFQIRQRIGVRGPSAAELADGIREAFGPTLPRLPLGGLSTPRSTLDLAPGWRFFLGDADGAQDPGYADDGWAGATA